MTDAGFSMALACAALGLGVSAAPARQRWMLLALLVAVTGLATALPVPEGLQSLAPMALGGSTLATAALTYFGTRAAMFWWPAVANLGLWLGMLVNGGVASFGDFGAGLPLLLLALPADLLRGRGLQVVSYVMASWVITSGFINLAFTLLRPSMPATDHML